MEMKKILNIILLFGIVLNISAQTSITRDIVRSLDELYVKGDTTILLYIQTHAPSGTARDAGNGIRLVGNDLDLGGALDSNVVITGAGYPISLGTTGSRLSTFGTIATGTLTLSTTGNAVITANGTTWTCSGSYFISSSGDTLAKKSEILSLIEENKPYLPFNFNYNFSATTTDSRPGSGYLRGNNATLANITQIYVDYYDNNSIDKNDFLRLADTGSIITIMTDVNNYAVYQLTGALTDASNYFKYNVEYKSHNGVLSGLSTFDIDISNNVGGGTSIGDSILYSDTSGHALTVPQSIYDSLLLKRNLDNNTFDTINANVSYIGNQYLNSFDSIGVKFLGLSSFSNGQIPIYNSSTHNFTRNSNFYLSGSIFSIPNNGSLVFGNTTDGFFKQATKFLFKLSNDTSLTLYNDSIVGEKAIFDTIVSNVQILNGDTLKGTMQLKAALETTVPDSMTVGYLIADNLVMPNYISRHNIGASPIAFTISVADTYYTIKGMTTSISDNISTTDSTSIITTSGYYDIIMHSFGSCAANNRSPHISLFVNGVEDTNYENETRNATSNQSYPITFGGTRHFNAGDIVKIKVKFLASTGTYTIQHLGFNIAKRH